MYKIGVNVPNDHLEALMDALDGVVTPIYPGYDHVFSWWPVMGCWRALEGSDPYDGRIGEVTVAEEVRLEFAVLEGDLGGRGRRPQGASLRGAGHRRDPDDPLEVRHSFGR